jgi:hypothetical protein
MIRYGEATNVKIAKKKHEKVVEMSMKIGKPYFFILLDEGIEKKLDTSC